MDTKDILDSISLHGSASEETAKIIQKIANREQAIRLLNLSSGLPRFHSRNISKFELIVGKPEELNQIHQLNIRCCLCNELIVFPAWYYIERFNVNHIHYFVCFDVTSPMKVTARCFRR